MLYTRKNVENSLHSKLGTRAAKVFLVHIKPFPKVSLAQGPHQGTKEPRATPRNQGTRAAKVNFKKKKTCRQILNHS